MLSLLDHHITARLFGNIKMKPCGVTIQVIKASLPDLLVITRGL